jgi:phosphoribosylaminoimidazole (AIR) synthetase
MPTVMCLVGGLGNLGDAEIRATFNGGIGMVLVVPRDGPAVDQLLAALAADGHRAVVIGTVVQVQPGEPRYREADLP